MARYGFFRPYRTFRGGVLPEPWHLSYAPVVGAGACRRSRRSFSPRRSERATCSGRSIVLEQLADIHERYVANVDPPRRRDVPPA